MDISSIVILALQVYSPPWDVRRGLNVRVRVVVVPDGCGLPTVMSPPVVTLLSRSSHSTSGVTIRPSTTSTVQVSV